MIAARHPVHRPPQAKLLVINARGEIAHVPRAAFVDFLRPGDLVVANDAATLPASLYGEHVPTGNPVEVHPPNPCCAMPVRPVGDDRIPVVTAPQEGGQR